MLRQCQQEVVSCTGDLGANQVKHLPPVNVSEYHGGGCLAVRENEVLLHPGYQVVFEGSLDDLVEEIWR